jgi:hypothetical protein
MVWLTTRELFDEPDLGALRKRRETWFEGQLDLDPERLVFIDETWASTNMARHYGRAPRGRRLRVGVPHGRRKTITVVAGFCQGSRYRPWPKPPRLGIGPPLTKEVNEDAVLGLWLAGRDGAIGAHRPGLSSVPLPGLWQAVQ